MKNKKYPKLPKVFKDKWVKALLSGKYKQGKGALYEKANETYCCLGVACVISRNGKDKLHREGFAEKYLVTRVPKALIGDSDNKLVDFLSSKNDGVDCKKWSFKKIGNWVKKNL